GRQGRTPGARGRSTPRTRPQLVLVGDADQLRDGVRLDPPAARRAGLHQALAATEWDRRASVALGEPLDAPALGLRLRGAPEQRRRAGVLGPESLRVHLDPPPGLDDPEDLAGVGVDVHN